MGNKQGKGSPNKPKDLTKPSGKKIKFGKKSTIPQSKLDRVPVTKSLNLEKCKYSTIPPNLFMIDQLEIINLNDNNIKQIEEEIIPPFENSSPEKKQSDDLKEEKKKSKKNKNKYKGIKLLRMSNNKLSSLPQSFANLQNLQQLQLVGNQFEYFPSILFELPKLKELSLKKNHIQLIECSLELIEGVTKLTDLDLSHNNLQYLPDEFTYLKTLININLEYNKLNKLPVSWKEMKSLHLINFKNNNLKTIPKSLFIETNVVRVDIEDNPVHTSKKYVHLEGFEEVK